MSRNEPQDSPEPEPIEPAQFNRLFVENQRALYAHIFTLMSRIADVEEVFQSTCVVLLDKSSQFEAGSDFLAWARRIAEFEVYNYRRRQTSQRRRFSDVLVEYLADERAAMSAELSERAQALRECTEQLPDADQELLRERYATKTTTKQLAERLGRSVGGLHKAIQRIRRTLRQCIERKLAAENRFEQGRDN